MGFVDDIFKDESFHAARVTEWRGLKDPVAFMKVMKQECGYYKIFNKKWKGPLFQRESGLYRGFGFFSEDEHYGFNGTELWSIELLRGHGRSYILRNKSNGKVLWCQPGQFKPFF